MSETKQEGAVNAKAAFLANITNPAETREVEGCTVQAIGDEGYSRVRALRDSEAGKYKGEDRLAVYNAAERAAFLSVGVVEPAMGFPEWQHHLKRANSGKIDAILEVIKELSGIEDLEVMLAKKLLGQTRELTEK